MKIHKHTILYKYTQTDIVSLKYHSFEYFFCEKKKKKSPLDDVRKDEKHHHFSLSLSLSLSLSRFGRCRSSNESNGFKRTPRCHRAVENHRNQEEEVVEEEEQRRRRKVHPPPPRRRMKTKESTTRTSANTDNDDLGSKSPTTCACRTERLPSLPRQRCRG